MSGGTKNTTTAMSAIAPTDSQVVTATSEVTQQPDRRQILQSWAVGGVAALAASSATGYAVDQGDKARFYSSVAQRPITGSLNVYWSGPDTVPHIALTFDDGPTPQFTPGVLDLLRQHKIQATFFVIGSLALRHPDLVRRARDEGHEIANHTFDHRSAATLTGPRVHESIARGAEAVAQVTGTRPRWLRPPRGEVTTATMLACVDQQQDLALWSVVRNGPEGGGADNDASGVGAHLSEAATNGSVIDLHDGIGRSSFDGTPDGSLISRRETELKVLPEVLNRWRERGLMFVTMSQLIAPNAG